jgi:Protein of unknown function (DUF3375)
MDILFSNILKSNTFVEGTTSLKLLRARNLPLIITFLYREYRSNPQSTIPYQQLIQRLGDFLEEINYAEEDEEVRTGRIILDYDEKAKLYIDRWIDFNYLRNVIDEGTKEPYVLLSKHTEKVFQVFELLREKEFVGTESKFKDIFSKLRDIVENANPDKDKKLLELEKRRLAIEEEIRRIKIEGVVVTYEDFQIQSRFEEVNRLANELIGDFKEVEDNFKEITRKIYEKQQDNDLTKGKLLAETFDSLFELKKTNQGKSFYAFWQFMIDDMSQQEFQQLTKEVYRVLEDRGIGISSRSLKKLKTLLHQAARKVLDKNGLLADKLSREIVAKDQVEHRKTRELMASIKQLAIKRIGIQSEREHYLAIELSPEVFLPLERKLGDRTQENKYSSRPGQASLKLEDLSDLSKIYSSDVIDKKLLLANIHELLSDRSPISLKQVVEIKGISKGLAELLAYITLVNSSSKFFVNEKEREVICFDTETEKYLEMPQIIFNR